MASVELRLWLVGKQSGWVQIGRGSCLIYVSAFSVRDEKFKWSSIAVVTPVFSGDGADCVVEDANFLLSSVIVFSHSLFVC